MLARGVAGKSARRIADASAESCRDARKRLFVRRFFALRDREQGDASVLGMKY